MPPRCFALSRPLSWLPWCFQGSPAPVIALLTLLAPGPLLLIGGLKSGLRQGERAGNVVMEPAGHFGVPPYRSEPAGSILRKQV